MNKRATGKGTKSTKGKAKGKAKGNGSEEGNGVAVLVARAREKWGELLGVVHVWASKAQVVGSTEWRWLSILLLGAVVMVAEAHPGESKF